MQAARPIYERPDFLTYEEYMHNKRVAIVGGADTSARVGDFDVVIRTNNHWLKDPIGRIDVLYHACGLEALPHPALKFVFADRGGKPQSLQDFWKGRQRHGYQLQTFLNYHPGDPDHEAVQPHEMWLECARNEYKLGHVFIGIVALIHVRRQPCREIFVTGFDFYGGTQVERIGGHRIEEHKAYCRIVRDTDPRVTMDEPLLRAISV